MRIIGPDSGMILASDSVLLLWHCWGRRGHRRGKGSVTRRNNGPISGLQACFFLSVSELIKSIHTPLLREMGRRCPHPSSTSGRCVAKWLLCISILKMSAKHFFVGLLSPGQNSSKMARYFYSLHTVIFSAD